MSQTKMSYSSDTLEISAGGRVGGPVLLVGLGLMSPLVLAEGVADWRGWIFLLSLLIALVMTISAYTMRVVFTATGIEQVIRLRWRGRVLGQFVLNSLAWQEVTEVKVHENPYKLLGSDSVEMIAILAEVARKAVYVNMKPKGSWEGLTRGLHHIPGSARIDRRILETVAGAT